MPLSHSQRSQDRMLRMPFSHSQSNHKTGCRECLFTFSENHKTGCRECFFHILRVTLRQDVEFSFSLSHPRRNTQDRMLKMLFPHPWSRPQKQKPSADKKSPPLPLTNNHFINFNYHLFFIFQLNPIYFYFIHPQQRKWQPD